MKKERDLSTRGNITVYHYISFARRVACYFFSCLKQEVEIIHSISLYFLTYDVLVNSCLVLLQFLHLNLISFTNENFISVLYILIGILYIENINEALKQKKTKSLISILYIENTD